MFEKYAIYISILIAYKKCGYLQKDDRKRWGVV